MWAGSEKEKLLWIHQKEVIITVKIRISQQITQKSISQMMPAKVH